MGFARRGSCRARVAAVVFAFQRRPDKRRVSAKTAAAAAKVHRLSDAACDPGRFRRVRVAVFLPRRAPSRPGRNLTTRGNAGTALAGSVAAALRLRQRRLLAGSGNPEPHAREGSAQGIGAPQIFDELENIPTITRNVVNQQLANLRASGDYDRIGDVIDRT